MRRIAFKVALGALALVAAAFAAEHLARALDLYGVSYYADVETYKQRALEPADVTPLGRLFQNKPLVALTDLKTFEYRTDERRLRTSSERVAPEGGLPVLFLGDSVTLGWGVDDQDTWVRRIERAAVAPDGRPLECLNFGHLMYDTAQEAALLRAFGAELRPEVVVLTFIYNDVQPTYEQLLDLLPGRAADPPERPAAWRRALYRAFPTLRRLARFRAERALLERSDKTQFPPYSHYPSGWPRCEAALDAVLATCAELGARLIVNDHTEPRIPEVQAWCERNGVLRLETALSEEDQRRHRNSVIDSHLNAEGNAIVAERAVDQLVAAGVVRRASSSGL